MGDLAPGDRIALTVDVHAEGPGRRENLKIDAKAGLKGTYLGLSKHYGYLKVRWDGMAAYSFLDPRRNRWEKLSVLDLMAEE